MPGPNTVYDLELVIEREAEEIIETLIRKAQERIAAAAQPKTDGNISDSMTAPAVLEPLDRQELVSIKALIEYIAHTQRLNPETLHRLVEMKFGAHSVADLRRQDYQRAVEYLVDLQDSGSMN